LAHKTDASNAAGGAASSATAALGHAVGWLGAKLDPTTRHTYKQVSVALQPERVGSQPAQSRRPPAAVIRRAEWSR